MGSWRQTLASARRRAAVKGVVHGAAGVVPFAAGAGAVWVVTATALERPAAWPLVVAGVAGAAAVGGLVGFIRRPSALAVANALDGHGAGHDVIASALQLAGKASPTVLEAQAVADADLAAQRVDVAGAVPWKIKRPLVMVLVAGVLLGGAAFVPERWPTKAVQAVGLKPGPAKVEVQQALADTKAAETLIRAVQPVEPARKPGEPQPAAGDPLASLREQLQRGEVTPKQATQQAATMVEKAADKLDQRAADAQAASELLRDRLSQGQKTSDAAKKPDGADDASELTRALREGNLEKAAAEAERLAGGAEKLSPQERAKLSEELKKVSDDLKKPEPPKQPADAPRPDEGKPPEPKSEPQSQAEKDARELADKIDRAAEDLKKPPQEQPPSQQPSKPPEKKDPEKGSGEQKPAQPAQKEQPREQSGSTPPQGEQPKQGEKLSAGEQPKSGEGEKPKPGEQSTQGEKPKPSDDPSKQGEKSGDPRDGKQGERPDKSPSGSQPADATKPQPGTERQGEPKQGEPKQGEPKPGEQGQPQSNPAQGDKPTTDGQTKPGEQHGEKPSPSGEQRQQQGTEQKPGSEQPTQQAQPQGAKPQPGEQQSPGKMPSMKELGEQLKKLAEKPQGAKQDRQDAQKLREQAQKLWDKATPEQRKEMEKLAREMARQHQGEKGDGKQGGGTDDQSQKPPEQQRASGESEQETPGGRGAGSGLPGEKPVARSDPQAGTTHDIDARTQGNKDQAPSRVIAEWLSDKPAARGSGSGGAAPAGVAQAVEQAQKNAEQAVQERTVPPRLTPLIRRFFDRLPQAVGTEKPAAPQPSPTPAPTSPAAKSP